MPPTQLRAHVVDNRTLSGGYFVLELETEHPSSIGECRPGQFVMLRGDWGRDMLNPRAFSVLHAASDTRFSVLLKVFGRGTSLMQAMVSGDPMTVTGPLGSGFVPPRPGETQLLVAGGVGLPPLHLQARVVTDALGPEAIELFYGARTAEELVLLDDFDAWSVKMHLTTEDGSRGIEGYVTGPLESRLLKARERGEDVSILACGPQGMLHAVRRMGLEAKVQTWLCLEEQMACGFGVCLGCAVPVYGPKPYRYCCTDGPVFDAREVRWS